MPPSQFSHHFQNVFFPEVAPKLLAFRMPARIRRGAGPWLSPTSAWHSQITTLLTAEPHWEMPWCPIIIRNASNSDYFYWCQAAFLEWSVLREKEREREVFPGQCPAPQAAYQLYAQNGIGSGSFVPRPSAKLFGNTNTAGGCQFWGRYAPEQWSSWLNNYGIRTIQQML